MTVVESPKGRASHNLGNRGAIPPFPPPGYCYIFFQNLSRKESSSPPAPSRFRLILRLEKTPLKQREIRGQFDGGSITSDAGGLLLREVEKRTGIIGQFASCFTDYRDPELVEHGVAELVAQRIYGLA